MFKALSDLIDRLLPPTAPAAAASPHAVQLATAVMLVEVMRSDASLQAAEREAVLAGLGRLFALPPDEAQALADLAHAAAQQATDLFAYTSALNARLDMPQKLQVVELMWQVAYADGTLAAHERHVLWRIADLLHVPQGAYVHARLRAAQAAGVAPPGAADAAAVAAGGVGGGAGAEPAAAAQPPGAR